MRQLQTWIVTGGLLVCLGGCSGGGGGQADAASGVTLAALAGTWSIIGSGTVRLPDTSLCAASAVIELVISANGTYTDSSFVRSSCSADIDDTDSGTVTVESDGAGELTDSDGDISVFQVDRSLNGLVGMSTDPDEWSHYVGIRD